MIKVELQNINKYFKVGFKKSKLSPLNTPIKWLSSFKNTKIHALKNISLSFKAGEIIGIIGQNGSGKSTLLRIIAKIYQPNEGQIITDGKIIPLLDVYAGIIKRLSVKENVILRQLFYGLTLKEANKNLDSIEKTSGVQYDQFKKLKDLSSGMGQKLSFTIALESNPDILLIDELFTTGDEEFRRKMFKKLDLLKAQGSIIIVTSHELDLIKDHCQRVIVLDKGNVAFDGPALEAINYYLKHLVDQGHSQASTSQSTT